MKKFLFLFITLLSFSLATFSQNDSKTYIQNEIIKAQKDLPLIDENYTVTKIYIQHNYLTVEGFYGEKNDKSISFKEALFLTCDKDKRFATNLLESGYGIKFIMRNSKNGLITDSYTYSHDELSDIIDGTFYYKDQLKSYVAALNRKAPIKWPQGLTVESAMIEGNYFVFNIKSDGSVYTNDFLYKNENGIDNTINNWIKETNTNLAKDSTSISFLVYLMMCNYGIKYSFKTNNKAIYNFYLTPKNVVDCIRDADKK